MAFILTIFSVLGVLGFVLAFVAIQKINRLEKAIEATQNNAK